MPDVDPHLVDVIPQIAGGYKLLDDFDCFLGDGAPHERSGKHLLLDRPGGRSLYGFFTQLRPSTTYLIRRELRARIYRTLIG